MNNQESFSNGLLEAPAYTKPNVFRGLAVPEILLGGNHPAIEKWKMCIRDSHRTFAHETNNGACRDCENVIQLEQVI